MGNFTSYDYRIDDEYIETRKSEINNIDINSDRQHYIDCKTDIDFYYDDEKSKIACEYKKKYWLINGWF